MGTPPIKSIFVPSLSLFSGFFVMCMFAAACGGDFFWGCFVFYSLMLGLLGFFYSDRKPFQWHLEDP